MSELEEESKLYIFTLFDSGDGSWKESEIIDSFAIFLTKNQFIELRKNMLVNDYISIFQKLLNKNYIRSDYYYISVETITPKITEFNIISEIKNELYEKRKIEEEERKIEEEERKQKEKELKKQKRLLNKKKNEELEQSYIKILEKKGYKITK